MTDGPLPLSGRNRLLGPGLVLVVAAVQSLWMGTAATVLGVGLVLGWGTQLGT
jgi:hypothetical protein